MLGCICFYPYELGLICSYYIYYIFIFLVASVWTSVWGRILRICFYCYMYLFGVFCVASVPYYVCYIELVLCSFCYVGCDFVCYE